MIVFSVTNKSSFENALNKVFKVFLIFKWYPEVNKDELANIPKLFVGSKIDMRDENDEEHI
jgi:GTPase SAR1 family protein